MEPVNFFIQGHPAPGGSKNVFPCWNRDGSLVTKRAKSGRVMPILRVTDDAGEGNKRWKAAVAIQARSFMRGAKPFDGALKVEFIFFLTRPQKHYRTGKFAHLLRDDAPAFHLHAPDALKFARSTEDALSGIVYVDDAQTVRICSEKRYCGAGDKEGCAVKIVILTPQPSTAAVGSTDLLEGLGAAYSHLCEAVEQLALQEDRSDWYRACLLGERLGRLIERQRGHSSHDQDQP